MNYYNQKPVLVNQIWVNFNIKYLVNKKLFNVNVAKVIKVIYFPFKYLFHGQRIKVLKRC